MRIRIPGTFVCLQGMPGDGRRNTIDSFPELSEEEEEPAAVSAATAAAAAVNTPAHQLTAANTSPLRTPFLGLYPNAVSPISALSSAVSSSSSCANSPLLESTDPTIVSDDSDTAMDDSNPVAVEGAPSAARNISNDDRRALDEWKDESRERELLQRQEWREASRSLNYSESNSHTTTSSNHPTAFSTSNTSLPWWITNDGCLALFKTLPSESIMVSNGNSNSNDIDYSSIQICGSLAPGMTVVATELITLSSRKPSVRMDITPIQGVSSISDTNSQIYSQGRAGQLQVLKLTADEPHNGAYVVSCVDGFPYLVPGLPANYCSPSSWWWVVSCVEGAYVRAGLDLSSEHLTTLPYGSLVRVQRKTVNAMALSRLQIQAVIDREDGTQDVVEGFCSEFLNPLSGQRGTVLHPLPFPVPAVYKVVLPAGAIIRSDVELSSPRVGHAPVGALLKVVSRAYSESPKEKCVARYRLAGDGGWISVQLNVLPPNDRVVAEFVATDSTFEPDDPGAYHLAELRRVRLLSQHGRQQVEDSVDRRQIVPGVSTISSIGDEDDEEGEDDAASDESISSLSNMIVSNTSTTKEELSPSCSYSSPPSRRRRSPEQEDRCLVCLSEDRSATIVHGETGHVACCLVCARILKARNGKTGRLFLFCAHDSSIRKCGVSHSSLVFVAHVRVISSPFADPCPVCRLPIDLVIQHFWA